MERDLQSYFFISGDGTGQQEGGIGENPLPIYPATIRYHLFINPVNNFKIKVREMANFQFIKCFGGIDINLPTIIVKAERIGRSGIVVSGIPPFTGWF
jgi:hypothetical protein